MKKLLLLSALMCCIFTDTFGQNPPANCADLFISEYSHGKYNNRALEIYNPTNAVVDLTNYQIGRNDNGGTTINLTTFPAGAKIQPYKAYVIICDKRDTTQYRVGLEYPIFDGYEKWDTVKKANGQPDTYTDGTIKFNVVVDTLNGNLPVRAKVYRDFLDLQCRATAFLNPVYAVNRTMYFSGNDGMLLFKGATPDISGFTNLIDMVGVYNDPGMVTSTNSWKDWRGFSVSENVTLVRKREVKGGTGLVAYARQDTFRYGNWLTFANSNTSPSFQNLGSHTCDCDPAPPVSARRTCNGTVIVASEEVVPAHFRIYPNPSISGNVTLEADGDIESLQVVDLMGRVIENHKMPIVAETVQLTLNVATNGLYFVKIMTTDKRIGVQKLMIKN
jgi:Lamin Tail Domain/Secretion system C-terminal sorting domain